MLQCSQLDKHFHSETTSLLNVANIHQCICLQSQRNADNRWQRTFFFMLVMALLHAEIMHNIKHCQKIAQLLNH